jgi:hypothetical protein
LIIKTLEDHLDEFCPVCKQKHGADWKAEFEHFICYKRQECSSCGYVLFKKLDFSSDGSFLI